MAGDERWSNLYLYGCTVFRFPVITSMTSMTMFCRSPFAVDEERRTCFRSAVEPSRGEKMGYT